MEYIARHYNMDLALVWALRLEGKTDQEKFKELEWGLRTWDQWNFNECDERFGDDWPGRIPAQLIAHTLFYFTKPGDLILDPMAGGGVVPDVCLLFGRKCQSFDLAVRDNRPEILCHHWDPRNWNWPIIKNPDLIFFDPPYYTKKEKEYSEKANEKTPSISSYTKEEYERFLEGFFLLAHQNANRTTMMAFLNADWRDFESTPALKEKPDKSITIFDYHRLLSETGWKVTHRIECPPCPVEPGLPRAIRLRQRSAFLWGSLLACPVAPEDGTWGCSTGVSSERLSGNQVQRMQDKRILGTVGRTLLIAKKT